MRVLIITDYLPYPLVSGDRIRVYNLVRRLAQQHEVYLAGFRPIPGGNEASEHLLGFCAAVPSIDLPRRAKLARVPRVIRYIVAGIPMEMEFLHSDALENWIRELCMELHFDIIQIEHSRMALYRRALPKSSSSRLILAFHNVAASQHRRIARIASTPIKKLRARIYGWAMSRWESQYAQHFDCCIAVSDQDRRSLVHANPNMRVEVVPNGVDTSLYRPLERDGTEQALLFIGNMSYLPNSDAAIWFCKEILPLVRQRMPHTDVWIVGMSPPPEVIRLNDESVHITGRVDDVLPFYAQCAVSVVPLRAGGGTRLKILESMALGRPVVSTAVGCEGLDVVNGEHLLIRDDPQAFANGIVELLEYEELRRSMAHRARQLAVQKYDWDAICSKLESIYLSTVKSEALST